MEFQSLKYLTSLFFGNNRKYKAGGGVGMFVNNTIDCTKRSDLMTNNPAMENISIEVNRNNPKNVILTCIYRPPDTNFQQFKNEMQNLLSKLETSSKIIFIGGDFNLNILAYNNDAPTTQFIDLMISHNFFLHQRRKITPNQVNRFNDGSQMS